MFPVAGLVTGGDDIHEKRPKVRRHITPDVRARLRLVAGGRRRVTVTVLPIVNAGVHVTASYTGDSTCSNLNLDQLGQG